MLNIEIKTVPHHTQRYDTVGDYFPIADKDVIQVSDMGNRKFEYLVAIHELIEKFLCECAHTQNVYIDNFDMGFKGVGEPGDDPMCPYKFEHGMATGIERLLCAYVAADWSDYEEFLDKLTKGDPHGSKIGKEEKSEGSGQDERQAVKI